MNDLIFKGVNIHNFDTILFDLDDTLYPEREFLFASYKNISQYLATRFNHDQLSIYNYLTKEFVTNGRNNLFDKLLSILSLPKEYVKICIEIMRTTIVSPKIPLFNYTSEILRNSIEARKNVIVVTNGFPAQQHNKIKSIEWQGLDKHIEFVFANKYKPKPNREVYDQYLLPILKVQSNRAVMIGDSEVDERFAYNIGSSFIKVCLNEVI